MNKALTLAGQPLSYFFIFSLFVFVLFPPAVLALPFPKRARARINAPFWRFFSWLTVRFATLSKVYKRDERPQEEIRKYPQGLYISNHQSFVDVPLVLSSLPIPPIMKKEVLFIPVLGVCGYSAGAMIVDRRDKESRKKVFEQAKERLTSGLKSLMFYPEGTRQRKDAGPKEFEGIKKPIIKFAFEAGIPVYSVSVYGTQKVLSPSSLKINYGKQVGIIIREARLPADYSNSEEFAKACWEDVRAGYRELEEKLS